MRWRLGLDMGAGSLGWCAILLDEQGFPSGILAAGSHIFGDGRAPSRGDQQGTPLGVERRAARAMRRRRDRFLGRQVKLLARLTLAGLFPADPARAKALELLDPYALRTRALDEALPPHHLGRAFFHLNQRRGFKSNRKTDRGTDDDAGKVALGINRLREAIEQDGARTMGEFLHGRRESAPDENKIPSVRTRLRPETGEEAKGNGYDFYPGRELVEEEFEAIWDAQAPYHPGLLTPENRALLHEAIFHQRPLKEPRIGKCTLLNSEPRLPKAHPLFQRRRLLEEVNALRVVRAGEVATKLTCEQRDLLLLKLKDKAKVSFESLRSKVLKLEPEARFNKEGENRKDLAGDEVFAQMAAKTRFGSRWAHFSLEKQWSILSRLIDEQDGTLLDAWLREEHGLDAEQARAVAAAHLPSGFGRFGETATRRLIEALQANVIVYSEAVEVAGLGHHSDMRTGEVLADLPYYGVTLERHLLPGTGEKNDPEEMRIGRLTNPTVHIALNRLRRIVNRLIKTYGRPEQIAIELGRELKLTEEEKQRLSRENNRNRVKAEARSKKLAELGQPNTGANRARLKLWEELNDENCLDRRCIYSGVQISPSMLFSDAVEVDHILPFDATWDDGNGNKILCLREWNRRKRKMSPYEAWGHTDLWPDIAARAARLPKEKRWRFEPDAMKRFDEKGGFIARHLVDTQYMSRLAREYLEALYPEKGEGSGHVWVSPGRLTELIRRKLGLNELLPDHNFAGTKNRLDHRHHTIDAFVVAVTDRSLLQGISRASALEGGEGRERVIVPDPWEGFREELRRTLAFITVWHRPDHGTASKAGLAKGRDQTAGKLHNDTAYGLAGPADKEGRYLVVVRKPLMGLKPGDIDDVRDPDLRAALRQFTQGKEGKEFEKALSRFPELGPLHFRGIRRLRLTGRLKVIPIAGPDGVPYKAYKGDSNYRYDVWELPDGSWKADVVTMFNAHQPGWISTIRRDCPTARKVLSLRQDDLIAIEPDGGGRRLLRVVKFGQGGEIVLAEPNEAGKLKERHGLPNDSDPFRYVFAAAGSLSRQKARQVRVDELGRVQDPGFPARKTRRRTRPKPEG
ncbi:type II CRISPR RNA-guided endonuclease Cas9 [Niveispirillum fermenti]|uniref:type II CRISPR RNA-guided endonuclease Cas9 n=1 Tax=Niveispirillum fermenti TaxID=1233113 RepID=UPI003A83623C